MNDFRDMLDHMAQIPGALGAIAAFAGLLGALVTVFVTRFVLGPRDRQDREAEWRKHAIELSKLDLDRGGGGGGGGGRGGGGGVWGGGGEGGERPRWPRR